MKISIRAKLFLSHFLSILLVSGSIGTYFYHSALSDLTASLQSRLKYSAALLSHYFDASELDTLISAGDMELPAYQRNITTIRTLAEANPDIAFVYVMRMDQGNVRFVLDSDSSDDRATPGEIYAENIPELLAGFDQVSVDQSITSDRWGSFMSGYAPITGGATPYLVGIDMRAREVEQKLDVLRQKGMMSLILAVLLAFASSQLLSQHLLRRIKSLHDRCMEHTPLRDQAASHRGDELDGLCSAFEFMTESMQATHEELERQVKSRTRELEGTNARLLREIDERKHMEEIIRENARTDYLTGLLNRREVTRLLDHAVAHGEDFTMVLVDIDRFKEFNDSLGHDAGDQLLKDFALALQQNSRSQCTIARWGGEEFLILMPDSDSDRAWNETERLRSAIADTHFYTGEDNLSISASFGVATHLAQHKWENTFKRADIALYEAKQQGRNCTVMASPEA